MREKAGHSSSSVMEAYSKSVNLAQQTGNPKLEVVVQREAMQL